MSKRGAPVSGRHSEAKTATVRRYTTGATTYLQQKIKTKRKKAGDGNCAVKDRGDGEGEAEGKVRG